MATPSSFPPRETTQVLRLVRWLLILVFIVLAYFVLGYLATILAPILAALGIAYLLNPLLERLVRRGASRAIGAGLLLVSFVGLVAIAIVFFAPTVAHQLREFVASLPRLFDNLSAWTKHNLDIEIPSNWRLYIADARLRSALGDASGPMSAIATAAVGGVFSVIAVIAELLLVPVFSYYFLTDWPNILRRLEHVVPPRRRSDIRGVARDIDRVVAGWVRGQAIVTSILAVLYAIGFTAIGMPLSLPIGLLVGGLTVIPFVGTFVGASIALLVALADGGDLQMLALVGGVILGLHLLEAAVLTPKIVGHRVGLSESGALLAVVAGGKLLGFVGVVLAVPLAATVAVLARYAIRYYEHTAFFGHESDADVVITPAMALIMPGIALGARVIETAPEAEVAEPELAGAEVGITGGDEWLFDSELPLGPSGRVPAAALAAVAPAADSAAPPAPAQPSGPAEPDGTR